MAQSIFDFIGRLLAFRYLGRDDLTHNSQKNNQIKQEVIQKSMDIEKLPNKQYTGQQCSSCGSYSMIKNGNCHVCSSCGTTTGCS